MTGDVQSEWRRGGPGKTPIDRVGVWQMRLGCNDLDPWTYHVSSLEDDARPVRKTVVYDSVSCNTIRQLQMDRVCQWRYLGPLPGGEPKKGDDDGVELTAISHWKKRAYDAEKERDSLSAALAEAREQLGLQNQFVRELKDTIVKVSRERDSLRQQIAEAKRMDAEELEAIKGQADAWNDVYRHCIKLGMKQDANAPKSGIELVLDFISARLSSPAEPSTELTLAEKRAIFHDVDVEKVAKAACTPLASGYMKLALDLVRESRQ